MTDKFPTVTVFKAALAAPVSKPVSLVKTILIIVVSAVVPLFYAFSQGLTLEIVEQLSDPSNTDLAAEYALPLLASYLLAAVTVGPALAYTFNYWVRFGAFGPDRTGFASVGNAVSATLINMLKFFLIILLLGLVVAVAFFVMAAIGIGPGLQEVTDLSAEGDISSLTLATLLPSIIYLVIICVIYSLFSANLTRTALQSDREGLEHPHTVDFAIVLFLLYLVVFIPVTIISLLNAFTIATIINYTLGLYIGFSIAVAHGLRYRLCIPEEEEIFE